MPFAVGAQVVVISLGKSGRVVEAARDGRYRVRMGAVVMQCREQDLADAQRGERPHRRHRRPTEPTAPTAPSAGPWQTPGPRGGSARRQALASLDLHGLTVEEAVRQVERHLDLAIRAGLESVEFIHGRSSGRIKLAVHRLLRDLTAIRHFEVSRDNPGVTRVFL